MAMCLAESLIERRGFDPHDQMTRYVRWWHEGYWSSTGRCFDIGTTTRSQLARFERTGEPVDPAPHDDAAANGSLITVGGFNDPFSPMLPSYENDHERYNLVPFVTLGDTSINVFTRNPSTDDNIFLAAFYVSGIAGINEPPPTGVPGQGDTLLLMGLGLAVLGVASFRRL